MRVLVTDGDTRTALAVVRSLGSKGHVVVVGSPEKRCLAGRSRYAKRFVRYPDPAVDREGFLKTVLHEVDRSSIELLLPVTDTTVHLLSQARDRLPAHVKLPIPTHEAVSLVQSKRRLLALAEQLGIPVPTTHLLASPEGRGAIPDSLRFPLVVKASRSQSDTGRAMIKSHVAFAADQDALDVILNAIVPDQYPVLLQERIFGDGVGYFALFEDGKSAATFYHHRIRERPYTGGESTLREAVAPDERIGEFSERLLREIGWFGPAMVEYKIDRRDGVPYLMEVNGRFWGSLQLAVDAGVDYPVLLVQMLEGYPVPRSIEYRVGTRTWWVLGDVDATVGGIARGLGELDTRGEVLTVGHYVRTWLNPRQWTCNLDTFRWTDPRPFLLEVRRFGAKFARLAVAKLLSRWRVPRTWITGVAHLHSNFSYDGEMSLAEVASLFRSKGNRFLLMTEHADDFDEKKMRRFVAACEAESDSDFLVIPGLEFRTTQGVDVLALGLRTFFTEREGARQAERIRQQGGLPFLAHPPRYLANLSDEFIRGLSGVEVWNIPHNGPIAPAAHAVRLLAKWRSVNPDLVPLVGADIHHRDGYKPIRMAMDLPVPDERAILDCVRRGAYRCAAGDYLYISLEKAGTARRAVYGASGWLTRRVRWAKALRGAREARRFTAAEPASRQAKVLHLIETGNPGGAEIMMTTLVGALDRDRFRPHAALIKPGWLADRMKEQGVPISILPMKKGRDLTFIPRLWSLVRRERIDLIHAHEFTMNVYGYVVARLARVPFVGTVHGNLPYLAVARRRLAYNALQRRGRLVTVSAALRREIGRDYRVRNERMDVVYNGVQPLSHALDPARARAYRREFGVEPSDRLIGIVGSLYAVKGHRFLLEAMPRILKAHPEAKLLVVGRGVLEDALKATAERLGIARRVSFVGFREDVEHILPILEIIVQPSLYEGLSLLILEAMSAGRPVVATRTGGNTEIIRHGETGLLVPPEDADAVAEAVVRLLDEPEFARTIGESARALVLSQFTVGHMARRYQKLYEELLLARRREPL